MLIIAPLGMTPNMDESPFIRAFSSRLYCHGLRLYAENTILIKEARSRNCHVITGLDLFVRQALCSFELFTGQKAPSSDVQDRKRALSPV